MGKIIGLSLHLMLDCSENKFLESLQFIPWYISYWDIIKLIRTQQCYVNHLLLWLLSSVKHTCLLQHRLINGFLFKLVTACHPFTSIPMYSIYITQSKHEIYVASTANFCLHAHWSLLAYLLSIDLKQVQILLGVQEKIL
jgi:hypothetical protein